MFLKQVRASTQKIDIDDPKLPWKRKVPSRYEEGEAPAEFVFKAEQHYRQVFYQATDTVVNRVRDRFQ